MSNVEDDALDGFSRHTSFDVSTCPESLQERIHWLAERYHYCQEPYRMGDANADRRANDRWRRYWPRISMPEHSVIWKLYRGGSVEHLTTKPKWKYDVPTGVEIDLLHGFQAEIVQHYVTTEEFIAVMRLFGEHKELPALPCSLELAVAEALVTQGGIPDQFDWTVAMQVLKDMPEYTEGWPGVAQEALDQLLKVRLKAAKQNRMLHWPGELRQGQRGVFFHQVSVGFVDQI